MPSRVSLLVSLLAPFALLGCASAPRTDGALRDYPATSPDVRVMGRHADSAGTVAFGASGVTFYMKFRGTALDVDLAEQPRDSAGHDWLTVVVDGGEPTRLRVERGTRRLALASGLRRGEHTLVLSKATEGQNGYQRLLAIHTAELRRADELPGRRIEFIGNSITSGYGLDARQVACGAGTWYDQTHAWLAFGPRVARAVGAQWMLSSVSGIGMLRNWNSDHPVMPDVYAGVYMDYADTLTRWDFNRYTPDLVVVSLGTNDFSDGGGPAPRPALDGDAFVRNYVRFVEGVRARYPRARLLLVTSPMLDADRNARLAALLDRVIAERAAAGDRALSRFGFAARYVAGCNGHPNLDEQARMAAELEPEVRAWMGW